MDIGQLQVHQAPIPFGGNSIHVIRFGVPKRIGLHLHGDGESVYVGETTTGMGVRFEGYRYGSPLERDTDNRVKMAIRKHWKRGRPS